MSNFTFGAGTISETCPPPPLAFFCQVDANARSSDTVELGDTVVTSI